MSERTYAREKFEQAVSNMAVGRGTLEQRVDSALRTIHTVKPAAFDDDEALLEAWTDLNRMFQEAEAGTNSLPGGLAEVGAVQVDRLAEQIVLVASRLREDD